MPKILLVEDNDINRDMLSRRLERKGYQVIVAVNGEESVAKTSSDRPDIVLMDLHLPVLDGWEATRQIKANPQTQKIPVIALTADAIAGEREKALAAGCDEYETKPVELPRLLQKITRLLESAASKVPTAPNPADRQLQRILASHLRHQLEPPIDRIVGYGELLLDAPSVSQRSDLHGDIQKIQTAGIELLQLVQALLNPVLVEIQGQYFDRFAPTLRLEMLTPLSTIIGYCELLLEEATTDLIPDLEQILTSAQELVGIATSLDEPIARWQSLSPGESIPSNDPDPIDVMSDTPTPKAGVRLTETSRVLVIDDNKSSSTLLSRQVERQGARVEIATASQVLHTLVAMPYDLVLLDVSLLSPNGFKVLARLKSHQHWRHIPVLILAAPTEMDRILKAIEMGAVDYVTKPCRSVLLHHKIGTYLERKLAEAAIESQLAALTLELEQIKQVQQVAGIVQTDYFQQLLPPARTSVDRNSSHSSIPIKILLVEDNELNCDMLLRRLERAGYEVVIANDGAEGVSMAKFELPDVILMDISLPVMDGWEATQQLKAHPQTAQIPIIALTAHAMAGDREKSLAAGCNDYDTKPIELPRLLGKIKACLHSIAT
jgi:CheY-like chemotaxis protein